MAAGQDGAEIPEGTEGRAGGEGQNGERRKRGRRNPQPLDRASLQELALAYVARFATSRAKLLAYLTRKLRERGWGEEAAPDPQAVADRIADLGYIDDEAFAGIKAASLLRRGYGKARVRSALQASGIGESDRVEALEAADRGSLAAALRFAERKRIGPYAAGPLERPAREKALAAMLRAGHDYSLARRIVTAAPGDWTGLEEEE